jgi:hypothetical protein
VHGRGPAHRAVARGDGRIRRDGETRSAVRRGMAAPFGFAIVWARERRGLVVAILVIFILFIHRFRFPIPASVPVLPPLDRAFRIGPGRGGLLILRRDDPAYLPLLDRLDAFLELAVVDVGAFPFGCLLRVVRVSAIHPTVNGFEFLSGSSPTDRCLGAWRPRIRQTSEDVHKGISSAPLLFETFRVYLLRSVCRYQGLAHQRSVSCAAMLFLPLDVCLPDTRLLLPLFGPLTRRPSLRASAPSNRILVVRGGEADSRSCPRGTVQTSLYECVHRRSGGGEECRDR